MLAHPLEPGTRKSFSPITTCLDTSPLGEDADPLQWWMAGVYRWDRGLSTFPLAKGPDEEGCVTYRGLTGEDHNSPARTLQTLAYGLNAGGNVAAGHRQRTPLNPSPPAPLTTQHEVTVIPGRVVTLTAWPGPQGSLSVSGTQSQLWSSARSMDRHQQGLREPDFDITVREAAGQATVTAPFEQVPSVATLLAAPGQELIIERPPVNRSIRRRGPPDEPQVTITLTVPDLPIRQYVGLAAVEELVRVNREALEGFQASGSRNTYIEGLASMAERDLVALRHDLELGRIEILHQRLNEMHRSTAEVNDLLAAAERDAVISLALYTLLAMLAAAALGQLLGAARPPRTRAVLGAACFLLLFAAVRWFHPGYGLVELSPEIITGLFVLAALVLLLLIQLGRRLEIALTRWFRRHGQRPDIDRYSLILTSASLGLSQLGRRRMRSTLTGASLVLIVFAFLGVAAMSPILELQPQPVGSDPAYQGLLVRTEDHGPMALRVPEDMREFVSSLEAPLPIHWSIAHRLRPPGEDWGQGGPPPFHPRHVVEVSPETFVTFRALTNAPARYGQLLGLHAAFVAGGWPEGQDEIALPLSAAAGLADDPKDLVGLNLSMFYEFPSETESGWERQTSSHRSVTVTGVFADDGWNSRVGLDGRPLVPVGIPVGEQLVTSANITESFNAHVVGWASATDGPPEREEMQALAGALPYSVFVGSEGARYVLGTALPALIQMALPMGVLGTIGLLMVTNTMLGAVYERRSEFRNMNVVGLAPHHIRAVVTTEGALIGVISGVLGWTFLLFAGGVLRDGDWLPGVALNVNSLYVVVLVAGLVLTTAGVSGIAAARAAQGVAPGRREAMIPAAGDHFSIDLPFGVIEDDIAAMLAFMWEFFHPGTSSSDSAAMYAVAWEVSGYRYTGDELVVEMTLLPRELGLNQILRLSTVPVTQGLDPTSRKVRIQLERRTGDQRAWRRGNVALLTEVRRQLLTWDLATEQERQHFHRMAERRRGTRAKAGV